MESSRQQTGYTTGLTARRRWSSAKDSQQTRSSNSSNHETDQRHFSTSTRDSHGADPTPDRLAIQMHGSRFIQTLTPSYPTSTTRVENTSSYLSRRAAARYSPQMATPRTR